MTTAAVPVRLARVCGVLTTCAAAAAGAWLLAAEPLLAVARPVAADGPVALGSLAFTDVLTGCCAAVLLACAGWVLGTAALLALARLAALLAPGSPVLSACCRFAEHACPRIARGTVVGLLGLGLGAATATPALADASGTPASGSTALDGLPLPDRATGAAAPPALPARPAPRVLQVRPGDSLWTIASHLLPPGADDVRVTETWHALHRTNHARIGDDPDLILPGTRLVVPDLTAPDREEHP